MDVKVVHELAIDSIGMFFNWALVILFLYLRVKGEKQPLTLSQRWALTVLIWLFLLNSLTIISDLVSDIPVLINNIHIAFFLSRVNMNLDVLIGLMLLSFGLVYPRPYTRWSKLQVILIMILIAAFAIVALQIFGHRSHDEAIFNATNMAGYAYPIGWYVPVIIWLPLYEKETSVHSRTALTMFMWGFIATASTGGITQVIQFMSGIGKTSLHSLISMTLFLYVMARLIRILWRTHGNWALPEKLNAFFLTFFITAQMVEMVTIRVGIQEIGNFLVYLTGNATWTIMRPAMFSYAILRFQIFGPNLKIDRPISFILGGVSTLFVVTVIQRFLWGLGPQMLAGTIIVLALILFFPLWKVSQRIVKRFLPLTGSERATMIEKRAKYLISLQTAVVDGAIDVKRDELVLEEQRKILGISRREHTLLMDSFAEREKMGLMKENIDEIFLVHFDGRLLVHVEKKIDGAAKGKDKDIVAGMLVAIREYVKEGLRSGATKGTVLDSIRYGNYSLVIETESKLVLAAVVKGPGSPELRQDLQDQLKLIWRRHGRILDEWNGNMKETKGPQLILNGFMEEMALL